MPIWKHTLTQESDLRIIEFITLPIVGERWWKVVFSYGDELRLQIGEKTLSKYRLRDREQGSWQLLLPLSDWNYIINNEVAISSADISPDNGNEYIEAYFHSLFASFEFIITEFTVTWPDLRVIIKFSNGGIFTAIPTRGEDDIIYWELVTPFDTILKVGPQHTIAYHNINELV